MSNSNIVPFAENYLKDKGFFDYWDSLEFLSDSFSRQYKEVSGFDNPRNIFFGNAWDDVNSFGDLGTFVVMELGGSYFKLFEAEVVAPDQVKMIRQHTSPFYEDIVYTPEVLFERIKVQLDEFVDESKRAEIGGVVFVFTFPLEQVVRKDGLIDAVCTFFAKGHRNEGIVGLRIGESLQNYLKDKGYPNIAISVTSDTPVSLLAAKGVEIECGKKFSAALTIIVGTGFNIATGVNMRDERSGKERFFLCNTECGDFRDIPLSEFDVVFKGLNDNPERYLTEKVISGAWQHHIFKVIMRDLVKEGILTSELVDEMGFENMDSAALEVFFNNVAIDNEGLQILDVVWAEINRRGAVFCGLLLSTMMEDVVAKCGEDRLNVAIVEVGSVIEKGRNYKKVVIETINSQLKKKGLDSRVEFEFLKSEIGTVLGAAVFKEFLKES